MRMKQRLFSDMTRIYLFTFSVTLSYLLLRMHEVPLIFLLAFYMAIMYQVYRLFNTIFYETIILIFSLAQLYNVYCLARVGTKDTCLLDISPMRAWQAHGHP